MGHIILTSTQVPVLLPEYQIFSEYLPSISVCFSPIKNTKTVTEATH